MDAGGRRSGRWNSLTGPLVVAGALAAASGYLAAVDPSHPGHYPSCPFYALTGMYCPGCGGLRAVHDLTHGEVLAALSSNAVVTLAVPVAVVLWFQWVLRRVQAAHPGHPAQPGYPAQSGHPAQPGYPAQSGHPGQPGYPAQSGYPGYLAQPGRPPVPQRDRDDTPGSEPKVPKPPGTRVWGPIALAIGLILFGVLRNLPAFAGLAP